MENPTKTFGQAALAAMGAAASQELSTKDSNSSETAHKRKFLETFRRWEILFKRKDGGNVEAEKWLIAEYYDSLRHLSAEGLDMLTKRLKENCIFFPTIKECLEQTRPSGSYDWSHEFRGNPPHLFRRVPQQQRLAAPERQLAITDETDGQ